tara:strand:+ start:267 stop:473 length:207 start_codon:yes stop_codon:yes gene_type:complete
MKIAAIGVTVLFVGLFALTNWSDNKTKEAHKEMGVDRLPNGVRIYEVEFDNIEYVVVERGRGIGITRK